MREILVEMFRHNLWANLTLIEFCAALPDPVLATRIPGAYGAIDDTLGHLAGTEEGYLSMLHGELAPGAAKRDRTTSPDLATLREQALRAGGRLELPTIHDHARASGEGLIAYAAAVEGDPMVLMAWPDRVYELPASLVLVQAVNHATEHRSQVSTALTQAGITPIAIDGWAWSAVRAASPS